MAGRVPLDELTNALSTAKSKIETWAYTKVTAAAELRDAELRKAGEYRASIADLQNQHEQLSRMVEQLNIRLAEEQGEENALQEELRALESRAAPFPARLQELQDALELKAAECKSTETELAEMGPPVQKDLAAHQKAQQLLESRLGMHFEHQDDSDEMRVVFTHIDRADEERNFTVGVRILENDTYEVTQLDPPVESIGALAANLNATGNFSLFIRCVRREFQRLV